MTASIWGLMWIFRVRPAACSIEVDWTTEPVVKPPALSLPGIDYSAAFIGTSVGTTGTARPSEVACS